MEAVNTLLLFTSLWAVVSSSSNCSQESLKYHFQSSLFTASNASKVINYRADVYLHCKEVDDATQFTISFESIETSIMERVNDSPKQQRRRKMPASLVQPDDPEVVTKKNQLTTEADETYKGDEDSNSTIGKWIPIPNYPVQFDRNRNGTISRIQMSVFDANNTKLSSIKRAIVFAFQTAFPQTGDSSAKLIPEHDELGYHFTTYTYQLNGNGVEVTKQVSLNDFIEFQRDPINSGMLDVGMVETQRFNGETLQQYTGTVSVEMATNTHPSQTFSVDERIKDQVAVEAKSNLSLVAHFPANDPRIVAMLQTIRSVEWALSEKPADVLDIVDDPLDHIAETFDKIQPTLYQKGIETIFDEFIENPSNSEILQPLLRSLQLEAQLYYGGKTKVRNVYDIAMPHIRKQLVKCERMQSWNLCLSFLNLAVAAAGKSADMALLDYLRNDLLPNIYRVKLLNMAIFIEHPTDYLVKELVKQHKSGEIFDDDEVEFRNHLLLAIGSTGSRITVSVETTGDVADYLVHVIKKRFANQTCQVGTTGDLVLAAAGNFLNSKTVERVPEKSNKLVTVLLDMARRCRRSDEVGVNALSAVLKVHANRPVMQNLMEFISSSDCQQKVQLVENMMRTMQFDLRQWPAHGVNEIDRQLVTMIMFQPQKLSCEPTVFADYFQRKKMPLGSANFIRNFGDLRNPDTQTNSTLLVRERRQNVSPYSYNVYTREWADIDSKFSVIQAPATFANDLAVYPTRRHILWDMTLGVDFFSAYMRAGFFTGKDSAASTAKLFGRLVVAGQLGLTLSLLDVSFMREQSSTGFYGYTRLEALGFTYLDLPQYTCNITIDQWSWGYQFALPVYTVTFGGFTLNMNADVSARATLFLYPSYCLQGDIGVMFKPLGAIQGNGFAEMSNTYFGIGVVARLYLDYFLELSLRAPDGCLRFYHGNHDMSFKLNIYFKIPTFDFTNINPTPSTGLVTWPIFQWTLQIQKGGKWAIFGWCPPDAFFGPDTVSWTFDDGI